jgi:hypothetical protein
MTPGITAALVAAPLSLSGALVMRWLETRARSTAWQREDRLRFLQDKRQIYSDFLTQCNWLFNNRGHLTDDDHRRELSSYYSVILVAPEKMLDPACNLSTATVRANAEEFKEQLSAFSDLARIDLGID